jgi:PAS domain S-box-containing protein
MTMFEGLLEAMPDALVGVDKAGVIRYINHRTEALFGYDRDDLVGAACGDAGAGVIAKGPQGAPGGL